MNEIKTLNGYPLADETARSAAATNAEAIGQLTEEMAGFAVNTAELLTMMLRLDALPVVQDADGAILIDNDGAIILG